MWLGMSEYEAGAVMSFRELSTPKCLGRGAWCINPFDTGGGTAGWIVGWSDGVSVGSRKFILLGKNRQRWEAFESDLLPLAADDERLPASPPNALVLMLYRLRRSRYLPVFGYACLLASIVLLYAGAVPDERDVAGVLRLEPTRDLTVLGCETTGDTWNIRVCTVSYQRQMVLFPSASEGTWVSYREYHFWRRSSPFKWTYDGAVPVESTGSIDA